MKGLEYLPDLARADRAISRLDPDLAHVQWLGIPDADLLWLRRLQRRRGLVFTAHDVLPRRTERRLSLWKAVFATVDRVVVHGSKAVEQLKELGVPPERCVAVEDSPNGIRAARAAGITIRKRSGWCSFSRLGRTC